jgi:protein-disulfide isomerase
MIRNSRALVGLALALLLPAPFARAQQTSMDDLKKEIQGLNETVKAMQKDLQEIKSLLTRQAPAAPSQNVLLDLDDNPTKGQPTAKLTLVEISDYQ